MKKTLLKFFPRDVIGLVLDYLVIHRNELTWSSSSKWAVVCVTFTERFVLVLRMNGIITVFEPESCRVVSETQTSLMTSSSKLVAVEGSDNFIMLRGSALTSLTRDLVTLCRVRADGNLVFLFWENRLKAHIFLHPLRAFSPRPGHIVGWTARDMFHWRLNAKGDGFRALGLEPDNLQQWRGMTSIPLEPTRQEEDEIQEENVEVYGLTTFQIRRYVRVKGSGRWTHFFLSKFNDQFVGPLVSLGSDRLVCGIKGGCVVFYCKKRGSRKRAKRGCFPSSSSFTSWPAHVWSTLSPLVLPSQPCGIVPIVFKTTTETETEPEPELAGISTAASAFHAHKAFYALVSQDKTCVELFE